MASREPSAEALIEADRMLGYTGENEDRVHDALILDAFAERRVAALATIGPAQGRDAVIEECARIAEGSPEDHIFCDHNDGYMDGRLDAAAAIRARRRGDDDDLSAGCRSAVVALDSPVTAPELAEVDEAIEKLRRSVESTPPATSDLRERATAVTPLYMRAVALIKKIELMERSEDEALVIEAEFAAVSAEAKAEERARCVEILHEEGWLGRSEQFIAHPEDRLAANRPSP